jgi:hypothetical protein
VTARRALIAALLFAARFDPAHAEPLGRLFHSAAERAALDALRKEKSQPAKATQERPPTQQPAPRLDGYVIRSDGKSTVWVNGTAVAGQR